MRTNLKQRQTLGLELTCANCRFYDANAFRTTGSCNRYAPRAELSDCMVELWPAWPRVTKNGWCGDHVRISEGECPERERFSTEVDE